MIICNFYLHKHIFFLPGVCKFLRVREKKKDALRAKKKFKISSLFFACLDLGLKENETNMVKGAGSRNFLKYFNNIDFEF